MIIISFFKESSFIELGAQWIRGTRGNPIYELANVLDLVDRRAKSNQMLNQYL